MKEVKLVKIPVRVKYILLRILYPSLIAVEGSTGPTAAASTFTSDEEVFVLDGIKADNKRFKEAKQNSFVVITLGQSQIIKSIRAYTDEVR